jgi:hypothetical protein
MSAVEPARCVVPSAGIAVRSAWCDDGDYARWFAAWADAAVAACREPSDAATPIVGTALHRLLVHVEAALSPVERVALYEALWRCAAACETTSLQEAGAAFSGRLDRLLAWLAQPVEGAALALARVHLDGSEPFPVDPRFAHAWLACALPRNDDDDHWLVLMRARFAGMHWGACATDATLDASRARCAAILAASADAAANDASAVPARERHAESLRLALDLAIAAGDEAGAVRALAACVHGGVQRDVAPQLLQRWLEGGSSWPLSLAECHQAVWLRPDWLHRPAYRAQVAGALRRAGVRARLQALRRALGDAIAVPDGTPEAGPTDPQPAPGSVLYALSMLDAAYALAEAGAPLTAAAAPLLRGDVLGAAARAALQRRCAIEAIDRIDPQAAALALADARRALGDPQDAQVLQQLLLAIDAPAARCAAASAGLPPDGDWFADAGAEARLWNALAGAPHPHLQPIALAQLATLHSEGSLVPTCGARRRHPQAAEAAWTALLAHPAHAARAQQRLADARRRLLRAAESIDGGRPHLWLPCAQPGARRVLIVFSCVESRDHYAQLAGLAGAMPGHHLLFINNPELNWYSDAVFDEVVRLIEQRVLPRFAREDVTCYFGSMGGHAALKFALHFGFQAIAFNPQIDLRLWAAFRPQQRALLLGARDHAHVQDATDAQFERSPACYFCGSATADREALRLWLQRVQALRHGSFIVETVDDPQHAGLIARLAPAGRIAALLDRTQARLRELAACGAQPASHAEVPAALAPRLWQQLAQAPSVKLEILLREGRLFVADSSAIGTAHTAPG